MKTIFRFLSVSVVAMACCLSLGFSVARAGDDGVEGGEIEGTETLDVDMLMTPTAAAPAGSSIEIALEAEDDEGTTEAKLELEASGLLPGTYNVSVTLKSNGSTVALGSFTADAEGEAEVEFGSGDEEKEETPFPPNFNPLDIATVTVSDSSNVVLFTADLTSIPAVTTMNRNANLRATPGPSAVNAAGSSVLNASVVAGVAQGSVQLSGHGLPPNTTITVSINHKRGKKARSDQAGNVSITLTPKGKKWTVAPGINLFQVTSVQITDKAGNVLLNANF